MSRYYWNELDVEFFIDEHRGKYRNGYDDEDIEIDYIDKKYTKEQVLDKIKEFGIQSETKYIYNYLNKQQVSTISKGRKRGIIQALIWFNRYKERCESSADLHYEPMTPADYL